MKYGQALYERSVAQWAPYNIDYNELKHFIREHTTKGQAQAVAIPGKPDHALQQFEGFFSDQLRNQHERVDLFVRSKADEFRRRLLDYEQKANTLVQKTGVDGMTMRRSERFSKLETRIMRCGEDIRNLERFVQAQSIGFRKILKKYRRWTGSSTLQLRAEKFLYSQKSFLKMDFEPLQTQYNNLITFVREHSPDFSEASTPTTRSRGSRTMSRSPSRTRNFVPRKSELQQHRTGYWNEYDHPSDEESNEDRYVVYVNPDNESASSWPGQDVISHAVDWVKRNPYGSIRKLINPNYEPPARKASTSEAVRQPLLFDSQTTLASTRLRFRRGSSPETQDGGEEDPDVPDPTDDLFPAGYLTHYATFPSVEDQRQYHHQQARFDSHRDLLLAHASLGCFFAAFILLFVSGLLLVTGRHKLRREVDAGVLTGGIGAMVFAGVGAQCAGWRWDRLGWPARGAFILGTLIAWGVAALELIVVMREGGL